MFEPIALAPSILSANFMNLSSDIARIEEAGAGFVHFDVMDGHFVPNLTVGVPVLRQLSRSTSLPCDVHLMISNPLDQIPWFLDAGAAFITVHGDILETEELLEAIALIHDGGAQAAVALKPQTPVTLLEPCIDDLDMVLVMSVEPGFSGQSYIAGSETKVASVVSMAKRHGVSPLIQVDGGINLTTAPLVAAAGADVLVCGNAVFGAEDPAKAVATISAAAEAARQEALTKAR